MRSLFRLSNFALLGTLLVLPACGGDTAPESEAMPEATLESAAPSEPGTIVDVAAAAGTFQTLLEAATAAGLAETLAGPGPFTVFAPTDEAFAALPAGTLEGLLADPAALSQVLLYHVVSGEVNAQQVMGMSEAATMQGAAVSITSEGGIVRINDATVITADIPASNGIIHVINQVLLPPSE